MSVQKSTIVWTFVLIILTCSIDIEAARKSYSNRKTTSSGIKSKTPNRDHYALSYGDGHGHRNTQPVHHQPVQQHQAHQQHSPSAPALPTNNNNNKPIGWNVPQHNTAEQSKTVSQTHSALPYPNNPPPPYTPNAGHNVHSQGPPPPYSQYPTQNTGFQSHVNQAPPPYTPNAPNGGTFHAQPPAYQPNPSEYYPSISYAINETF